MYSLLLKFDRDITRDDKFFNDLKNEMLKRTNNSNSQFIYHIMNGRTCLLYVETENIMAKLIQSNKIQLPGNLCHFIPVDDELSSCIQILFYKSNLNITEDIRREIDSMRLSKFSLFSRGGSLLIHIESSLEVQKVLANLYNKFNALVFKEEIDITVINLKEFVVAKYVWNGPKHFSEIVSKLKSSGRSLVNVLQGLALSWEEVPCILDTYQQTIDNQVFILFPTAQDEHIFTTRNSGIEILGGELKFIPDSIIGNFQTDVFILWVFDQCFPKDDKHKIISSPDLSSKVDEFIRFHLSKSTSKTDLIIKKYLYIEKKSSLLTEVRTYITKLSDEFNFSIKVYDKSMSTDNIIGSDISAIVMDSQKYQVKPTVCLMLSNISDCSNVLSNLNLNGFNDIVLFSSSSVVDEYHKYLSICINWQKFLSESISSEQLGKSYLNVTKKMIPNDISAKEEKPVRYTITDARKILESTNKLRESKSSNESQSKSDPNLLRNMTFISDLQCLSIATHFKHLMLWTGEAIGSTGNELKGTFLYGEETFSKYYEPNDVKSTNVMIVTDSKAKVYQLIVSGPSNAVIQRRYAGLQAMSTTMLKYRKTYPLPSWDPHHRECLIGSNPLIETEKSTEASALLHINEGTVVLAEVVAMNIQKHRNMRKFLEDLIPKHVEWIIPYSIATQLKEKNWTFIKVNYAVKVDLTDLKNTMSNSSLKEPGNITLNVWGFESYLDSALEYVLSHSDRISEAVKVDVNAINTPESFKSQDAEAISSAKQQKPVHGSYVFQDREAGIYYSAFEKNFRSYIVGFFNVTLSDIKLNSNDGSPDKVTKESMQSPYSVESQSKSPALKIEFWGTAQSVKALRAYLDQLNMKNLMRYQFHFPCIDSSKYREICNEKSKEDYQLKEIRSKEKSKLDDPTVLIDPIKFLGFINIRVKPPLNNRGIKRMAFPVDATLTVCGPITNADQRKCIEDTLRTLKTIKSGYYELKAIIPLNTPLAKELTSKISRQQYSNKHKLLCIRWEEAHRPTGGVGITHIWSRSQDNIDLVLQNIIQAGGSIEEKDINPSSSPQTVDLSVDSFPNSSERESTSSHPDDNLLIDTDSLTSTALNSAESMMNTFSIDNCTTGAHSLLSESSCYSFNPTPKPSNAPTPHVSFGTLMYWPQIAYKYMFQADPLKSMLLNKLVDAENSLNVKASFIVSDPNACFALSGLPEDVTKAKESINQLFKKVSYDLCSVELILSLHQFNEIIDKGIIADIEVIDGVHIVDNPIPDDTCDTLCTYDLRFVNEVKQQKDFNKSDELISTILRCENHNQEINIVVMKNEAGAVGWTWGVSCLILILDEWSSTFGLSPRELESLRNKEVLVNMDSTTGKIILRVKPDFNIECTKQSQAESYMIALCKALSKADELGIQGVVFMTPNTVSESFSELSMEMIKSLTVEGSIGYLVRSKIANINRIVFLEDQENILSSREPSTTPKSTNIQKCLTPAYGNRMALAVIVLMGKFSKQSDSTGMEIVSCNFPIPYNMPFSVISKPFSSKIESKHILIRGLPVNVVVAVDHLKKDLFKEKV